jgi:3-methyladenine DNA glycosylase Tag
MTLSLLSARLGIRDDFKFLSRGLFLLKARYSSRSYCVQVLKRTFVFTGGEIVNEFLMSTGYLPGAHTPDCPIYEIVLSLEPAWNSK